MMYFNLKVISSIAITLHHLGRTLEYLNLGDTNIGMNGMEILA